MYGKCFLSMRLTFDCRSSTDLAIFTPEELAGMSRPTNWPDAAAKGAINGLCRAAPILAGYGLLSGNLPAVAFGTGGSIACGLPLFPVDPVYPVGSIPLLGGQCPIMYDVRVKLLNHNEDCSVASRIDRVDRVMGPVSQTERFVRDVKYECRATPVPLLVGGYTNGNGDNIQVGNYSPAIGGFFSVSASPVNPGADVCGNTPYVAPPLPPGAVVPPGYPNNPYIPGFPSPAPIYDPDGSPDKPPRWIPFRIPDIPLPLIIPVQPTLNVPINVPINIPVKVDINPALNISPTFNFQLDQDGNIRTAPDLICPCEYDPQPQLAASCPETTLFQIPFYSCAPDGGSFKDVSLEVVESSIPVGLFDKLLSSANLAEIGCESVFPVQKDPVRLYSGRFDTPLCRAVLTPVLPEDVFSVELRITEFPEQDIKEISVFPGAEQFKFGSIEYTLGGIDGGATPHYVWDRTSYYQLPPRVKAGRLKILLRPGVSWELWDTGERKPLR